MKLFKISIFSFFLIGLFFIAHSYIDQNIIRAVDEYNSDINNQEFLSTLKKPVINDFSFLEKTENNFVEIAKKAINTVVHVKSSSLSNEDFSIEDFLFGKPQIRPKIGSGSGVIISSDGYIVTNHHVIENSDQILSLIHI